MKIEYKKIIKTLLITIKTEIEDLGDENYKLEISCDDNNNYFANVYRKEMYRLTVDDPQIEYSDVFIWIEDTFFDNTPFNSLEELLIHFKGKLKYMYNIKELNEKIDTLEFK